MKKETEDLLIEVIKDYMGSAQEDLVDALTMEDYNEARARANDIAEYCNCIDQFTLVEDITKMTKEEFSTYFSTFDSWEYVREWIIEPDNWEEDIRLLAEQNELEEGVDEVIALLK